MISKNQIKLLKSLEYKKYRKLHGLFVAEGPKLVNELLLEGWQPKHLFHLPEWQGSNGETGEEITDRELSQISQLSTPNEVLAVLQLPENEFNGFGHKLNLVIDGIKDPGNLGTMIRLADWYGLKEIFLTPDCTDAFSAKTVQASMGSIFRIKITQLAQQEIVLLPAQMAQVLGAFLDATPVKSIEPKWPLSLVIGSESHGISQEIENLVTHKISIERKGKAESLNAAMACGILLDNLL
ncbi:MAG: RNA methyltransferase [Bacteroidetes bacterium]|nr:RNA methyltransferase [Bacteroidota bacterium]